MTVMEQETFLDKFRYLITRALNGLLVLLHNFDFLKIWPDVNSIINFITHFPMSFMQIKPIGCRGTKALVKGGGLISFKCILLDK